MTSVRPITEKKQQTKNLVSETTNKKIKADDNIFSQSFRKVGLDGCADFFRDDWSANIARKAGFSEFADWIDNKPVDGKLREENIFSKIARTAVKHPVLTIATVVGAIFAGKHIYKTLSKNSQNINKSITRTATATTTGITASADTIADTAKVALKETPPKPYAEEVMELKSKIFKGLQYQKQTGFKNVEILEKLTPTERQNILRYLECAKKENEFLMFASGSKPATMQSLKNYTSDIFDCLRSDKIAVSEFFTNADNFIINKKQAEKIITKNKDFFATRLGMPKNTTVKEICDEVFKSSCGKLSGDKKFIDLKQLLQGATEQNAWYAQIRNDIRINEQHRDFGLLQKSFLQKSTESLEGFKQALKESLNLRESVYKDMPQSFKDKLAKMIDSITPEQQRNLVQYDFDLFQDAIFKDQELRALRNLAKQLENAQKYGSKISLS